MLAKIGKKIKRAYKLADNNQGVALVVVMVIGAVIMAFCLSMLLVTYTLFAQTSRKTTQLRCKMLAQSYSDVLNEEFKKETSDSELQTYLCEQIRDKKWIAKDSEADSGLSGTTEKLELVVDQSGSNVAYGYTISTTFSYEEGDDLDEDDDEIGDIDDDDDEEEQESGDPGPGPGSNPDDPASEDPVGGIYQVTAVIKCARGDGTGKDPQIYTIERQYTLTVKAEEGDDHD